MMREAALGFDVGTTAVKAGLLWLDADEPMLTVRRTYPTSRLKPGWVEQDPADWIAAMTACWTELQLLAGPVALVSVGVCSQVNTHLFVDADLSPLRPAITWQDTRAASEAAELDALVHDRKAGLWGTAFTIDPSFSLARVAWLARHEPEARRTARCLLLPKDYCIALLTGEVCTDAISQVGLVGAGECYLDDVLALVDGAADLVPSLLPFDSAAGMTRDGNALGLPAGVPVAVSTMDAWGSIFGAGMVEPGRALDVGGTSEIVALASDRSVSTAGIVSFPPVRGRFVHAGPTQAGGAALDWVAAMFSCSVPEALALAAEASGDAQSVVFLPHLAGERAPYWNPDARGVFMGMTTSTEARHLVLAVMEGVAFSVRMLLGLCEQAADVTAARLRVCGGAARSELWNQLKSTAVGRPVDVLDDVDAGVVGAALLGMVAADPATDLDQLVERHVKVGSTVEPGAADGSRMDEMYGLYVDTYRALEPLFPRFGVGG